MAFLLALMSAFANALTSILQRMGFEDAPDDSTLKLSLLTHALRRGVWPLGFGFMVASFLLKAVALHLGDLSQGQPILTTEMLFIVLLPATWFRFRVGLRERLGCAAAAGSLAGFLVCAQPGEGDLVPTTLGWVVVASICVGVMTLSAGPHQQAGPIWVRRSSGSGSCRPSVCPPRRSGGRSPHPGARLHLPFVPGPMCGGACPWSRTDR